MAGGAGVEWYFGYEYENNDLNCEDWRSRDILWKQTDYALEFFRNYLPYGDMHSADIYLKSPKRLYKFLTQRRNTQFTGIIPGAGVSFWEERKGQSNKAGSIFRSCLRMALLRIG